jgi:hypothetical protein
VKKWINDNLELSDLYHARYAAENDRKEFRQQYPKCKATKVKRVSVEIEI